jgi:hypothetical protein
MGQGPGNSWPRISRIGTDKPFLEKPLLISLFLIFFLDPCFFDPQDPCVFRRRGWRIGRGWVGKFFTADFADRRG